MKKLALFVALVFSLVAVNVILATETNRMSLKAGDELYVCGCGKACDCDTMAMKPGKCVCGKPMVKGKVTKAEKDIAIIKTDKEERPFKLVGLYACGCTDGCDCNTISQKPGKCVCGKPLKKVEAKK